MGRSDRCSSYTDKLLPLRSMTCEAVGVGIKIYSTVPIASRREEK